MSKIILLNYRLILILSEQIVTLTINIVIGEQKLLVIPGFPWMKKKVTKTLKYLLSEIFKFDRQQTNFHPYI